MADQHPIIAGAEPLSVAGGPVGVLVLLLAVFVIRMERRLHRKSLVKGAAS